MCFKFFNLSVLRNTLSRAQARSEECYEQTLGHGVVESNLTKYVFANFMFYVS